ncbi:MAG: OmpA family protein, partial [Saprospiraceae bacterium]
MSILRSRRDPEGNLFTPEPFAKELSSLYHEGPVCFDRTAETVYFSRNVDADGKSKLAQDGTQKMRIYSAKKTGDTWSTPVPLPFNNGEFDDCHPAISIDGDKLYFASNRPGGKGKMDLYVAYRVGEGWSEPVNLGDNVNTDGNEVFPFIHADNSLYYASSGLPGQGGFDMFYVIPDGNGWTTPVNLGNPFNTAGDDFGLIVDLNKINGYYNSNGAGGAGGDEIFSFHTENGNLDDYFLQNDRVPMHPVDLKIVVTDKNTRAPIADAEVKIVNAATENVLGRDDAGNLITVQSVDGQNVMRVMTPNGGLNGTTNSQGIFTSDVFPATYVVSVSKSGYQTKQLRLPITKPGNEIAVQLEKAIVEGKAHWNASLFNYMTNAPLAGAAVILTNHRTGQRDTVYADANGLVDHYLDPDTKYKVEIYQGGRVVGSSEIDTHGWPINGPVTNQNFSVAPVMPGFKIELPNIYYNFNDATLRPDARQDLNMVVSLMKQQSTMAIELASHTDCRGSAYYNQDLSQRRANGVVEYLIAQGIDRSRMRPVGYGESELLNNCTDGESCTELQHARNRRTEMRMTSGFQAASVVYVDGQITSTAGDHSPQSAQVNVAPLTPGNPVPVAVGSADRGGFYVIVGSFLMENRAQNRLADLVAAGYTDAQVLQFPNSTFYSVCAGRFGTRREAVQLEKKIESENSMEAFVRAMQ